ncbi:MAG: enoyl-CoA hydratase/isomerase family protein [Myxococcales bacterium]|nr:enoyl-CoA hydratase/isomerase family protein [Myxococcales bacterium]
MPPSGILREDLADDVARLVLDNGHGNAINAAMVGALEDALLDLEAAPPRALVLDGGTTRWFSGGFDLTEVLKLGDRDLRGFLRRFFELLARLVELPCPTVAAVQGSAVAGGFLLALACDFRVLGEGAQKLGLSEVDVGVAVPATAQVLLAARTTPATSLRLSLFATLLGPEEALEIGVAEALHADPRGQALALAQALARKPGDAARVTKRLAAGPLARAMRDAEAVAFDAFVASWRSDAAQARLHGIAARQATRKGA